MHSNKHKRINHSIIRFNENRGGLGVCVCVVRVRVYTVYPITNLNWAKPKWWNYEYRRVQQFPDFHVFIFQLCDHPCPMRVCVSVYDALSRPQWLSPHPIFSEYHLHECIYVSYWTQYTHSLTLSFSAMSFRYRTYYKTWPFGQRYFNILQHSKMNISTLSHKLKSAKSKRASACTWANK